MGSEVNQLIGKINSEEAKNITIPVIANISGSFTKPTVKTDLTSGVSALTKQLIDIQKQKLLNQGKDKAKDMLGEIIGANKTKTDSIKKGQNSVVNDVLKDIMGNKPKTKDTTTTKTDSIKTNPTTDAVKNVLGGLLGKKKKTKDTIN